MERKTFETTVGQSLKIYTDYYAKAFSIDELQNFLTEAKEKGATHFTISGNCYESGLDDIDIQPVNIRTETDEEYSERVAEKERKRLAEVNLKKAEEKALYEKLKLKYGD
jgi:hypothetical protein